MEAEIRGMTDPTQEKWSHSATAPHLKRIQWIIIRVID